MAAWLNRLFKNVDAVRRSDPLIFERMLSPQIAFGKYLQEGFSGAQETVVAKLQRSDLYATKVVYQPAKAWPSQILFKIKLRIETAKPIPSQS